MRMRSLSVITVGIMILLPICSGVVSQNAMHSGAAVSISQVETVESVPYVWQEINGFCNWAATSSALQYIGVNLDLADVFSASTVGFSYAYFRYNDSLLTYPGVIYKQVEPTQFLCELYGVNFTIYVGQDMPGVESAIDLWERQGVSVGTISGQSDALQLMKNTIDRGYPLLVSVDPSWLPAADYDYLRSRGLRGGGHAILVVGYNDTQGTATIIDPGVGSFGDDYGYPVDGRGNYSTITYSSLNAAWSSRYYISELFQPGGEANSDYASVLGAQVRDKLLGVGTTYAPSSSSAFLWSFGEKAFREMSSDVSPEGILDFLSVFDGINNEQAFKAAALVFIGIGIESSLTLQYLSFKFASRVLPDLLNNVDLIDFSLATEHAISLMSDLASNSSLIYPGNLTMMDGRVSSTYAGISTEYNSSGNLEASLNMYSDELSEISNILGETADAWLEAGNELAEIWPTNSLQDMIPYLVIGGLAVVIVVFGLGFYIVKKPSQ